MPKAHDYRFLAEIGRRLSDRREALNMTQAQTAKLAKIQPQQLSKYELGLSDPPLSTLLRICAALKINTTALLVQTTLVSEGDKRP